MQIKGQIEQTLNVPNTALYAYLLDFTRHPEWSTNLSKVSQLTPGPIAVGTRFRAQEGPPPVPLFTKLRMMRHFIGGVIKGARPYSEATITALEPGHKIAWRAGIPHGEGFFNLAEWEFILEPEGQATRLIQHFCYKPQAPGAANMVGAAGVQGIAEACTINLLNLKRVAEQRLAQPSPAKGLTDGVV